MQKSFIGGPNKNTKCKFCPQSMRPDQLKAHARMAHPVQYKKIMAYVRKMPVKLTTEDSELSLSEVLKLVNI